MISFDRFADRVESKVASATFFTSCVLLVVIWAPTLILLDLNTAQLIINTVTTIITFLLIALLQNTQHQFAADVSKKLDLLLAEKEK